MSLVQMVNQLRRYLPIQYPLGVFIHNNMLQTFEEFSFEEGVTRASEIFGASTSLDEEYYEEKYLAGRIESRYLLASLMEWRKQHQLPMFCAGVEVNHILLQWIHHPLPMLECYNEEVDHLSERWDYFLELANKSQTHYLSKKLKGPYKNWKLSLKHNFGDDVNQLFHPVLIRFLTSYLDQGMAQWHIHDRRKGLRYHFYHFLKTNRFVIPSWMADVVDKLAPYLESSDEDFLNFATSQVLMDEPIETYLLRSLLELRGWAGMVNKFETEPEVIPRYHPKVSLFDYLGLYLLLEAEAQQYLMGFHHLTALPDFVAPKTPLSVENLAYVVDKTFQVFKDKIKVENLESFNEVIELFLNFQQDERGVIWQRAFDLSLRDHFLDSFHEFRSLHPLKESTAHYKGQFLFCIDDREESIRRHLEEINSEIKTYGVVGFFGLDMKFKSLQAPLALAFCPPVVTPQKIIFEEVDPHYQDRYGLSEKRGKWLSNSALKFYYQSRGSFSSVLFTWLSAPFTAGYLLGRVFFPRSTQRNLKRLQSFFIPETPTKLVVQRRDVLNSPMTVGYEVKEMAGIVNTILSFTGLKFNFAPFIFILGHGASSSNNPFKNAYGCGACSGKAGIPNSKVFCEMANNPEVRNLLEKNHNIVIPSSTLFLACYHDTATDDIEIYNEYMIPVEHRGEYQKLMDDLKLASQYNALERCRHFDLAKGVMTIDKAYDHVHERGANLAEPRPEYGHTNNSLCIIGRRELTKNLYLDRRSFLPSYDYRQDPSGEILAQVMAGAVPVCGGINLDYYFSRIDNEIYGSGTKLPLNISSLLGVMTGSCSDLRIGLAWQMVELHEPVRITFVIEAPLDRILKVLEGNPRMKRMAINEWIHLLAYNAEDNTMALYKKGEFVSFQNHKTELSNIHDSLSFVKKKSGPLPYADIELPETVIPEGRS